MKKNEALKNLDVITAYANGADVQYKRVGENTWNDTFNPGFSPNLKWRVKPLENYYKLNVDDFHKLRHSWFKNKEMTGLFRVTFYNEKYVTIAGINYSYEELFNQFTFEDGTPCGKIIIL